MTLDVETSGLDWTTDLLHGIGVGYSEDDSEYYPYWAIPTKVIRDLANPDIAKIGHNLHAFDAKFIRRAGFDIQGQFHDTMVLANLVDDTQSLGLKYLADKYLGRDSLENKRELDRYISKVGAGNIAGLCARDIADTNHPHTSVIAEYCKEDVTNTTRLFWVLIRELTKIDTYIKNMGFKKSPKDYYLEEAMPLERVLFEMEYRGIRVNLNVMTSIRDAAVADMTRLETLLNTFFVRRIPMVENLLREKEASKVTTPEAKAKRIAGQGKCKFNWGNNNHFGVLLYKFCDLDAKYVKRTVKGAYQIDKASIDLVSASLPRTSRLIEPLKLYSEYKLHAKIAQTYTGNAKKGIMSCIRYDSSGVPRIYPVYQQTSHTGRLRGSNPNMQNLKRDSEIKKFFIPEQGDVFDDVDYSQIELRTGAHLSQDPTLIDSYNNDVDVHLITATNLFGRLITKADDLERQAGKRTNFLTIFDGKAFRLAEELKKDTGKDFTIPECKNFIKIWFETYPEVRTYLDSQLEFFRRYRFCITETGRVRLLPDIDFGKWLSWTYSTGKSIPTFTGPASRRAELVEDIKAKSGQITDENIGWAAYARYSHATKAGYNQPIQGLAASMTKRAMIALYNSGILPSNQVHDSLTVSRGIDDIEAKHDIVRIMETTYKLSIPVKVDVKTLKSFHPKDTV